jgi:hypothetical protein
VLVREVEVADRVAEARRLGFHVQPVEASGSDPGSNRDSTFRIISAMMPCPLPETSYTSWPRNGARSVGTYSPR